MSKFDTYLAKNLSNPSLSVPQIADDFAMSESTLLRKVKHCVGITPVQYLLEKRLEMAYRLLLRGQAPSVEAAANRVGYASVNNFSRSFKNHFDIRPSSLLSA